VRIRAELLVGKEQQMLSDRDCRHLPPATSDTSHLCWVKFSESAQVTQYDEVVAKNPSSSEDGVPIVATGILTGSGMREFGHEQCCGFEFRILSFECIDGVPVGGGALSAGGQHRGGL